MRGFLLSTCEDVDPKALLGVYGETPAMVRDRMAEPGLDLEEVETKHKDKTIGVEWSTWRWSCETEKLPSYTARAQEVRSLGSYAIYSAAAHAEWHAVMAGWREEAQPGGSILVARPDLWAGR